MNVDKRQFWHMTILINENVEKWKYWQMAPSEI